MSTFAKGFAWVICGFSLLSIAGCGGNTAEQKSTQAEMDSFRADPSKMPADAKKYMQPGKSGARPGQAAPPAATGTTP
jgi:hypothetical protein